MTYSGEISQCGSYSFFGGDIWYANELNLSQWRKGETELILNTSSPIRTILSSGDALWFLDENQRQMSLNTEAAHEIIRIDKNARIFSVSHDYVIYYWDEKALGSGVYNHRNDSDIFRIPYSPSGLVGNSLNIHLSNAVVRKLDHNGIIIWETDIKNYSQNTPIIPRLLGEYAGSMYVATADGIIIEIDDLLGSVSQTWSPVEYVSKQDAMWFRGNIVRRHSTMSNGLIHGFIRESFWQLDLFSKMISTTNLSKEFSNEQITGCWSALTDDQANLLYFVSDQSSFPHSGMNHKLVEFDSLNKTIKSQWQLPELPGMRRGLNINGVQLSDKYVCIYEQNRGLHVFSKK